MNKDTIKGRARILVSDSVVECAPVKIEKPKAGQTSWGMIEAREVFDTFAAFLLLPEGYTIIGVYFDVPRYSWTIIVESDAIPLPEEGMMIPTLELVYQRTEDGKVSIVDMQLRGA